MATISTIENILQKAKAGQYVTIKCAGDAENFNAHVVSLDTAHFGAVDSAAWTEGWVPGSVGGDADPEDTSDWGKLVAALEDCSASDFSGLTYTGSNELLTKLAVGAGATVKYDITPSAGNSTTWINLGFNASIPEYVKYRKQAGSGWKHVWVKSTDADGMLKSIASGDAVYTREYDETKYDNTYTAADSETITGTDGTFTYGNNCTYAVPASITTSAGTYDFCGYNITLNSKAILMHDALSTYYICFDRENNDSTKYRNIYQTSPIRHFMNDASYSGAACYNGSYKAVDFPTLITRFSQEDGFLKNVCKTVNRTWVHSDHTGLASKLDTNGCTNDADKFWLLGVRNINCTKSSWITSNFKDQDFDTFYSPAFTESDDNANTSRVKYKMNADGSVGSSAGYWWLRSARSSSSLYVGLVSYNGVVNFDFGAGYGRGLVPAALIG